MKCLKCGTAENVNFEGMCKKCYEESLGIIEKDYSQEENKKKLYNNWWFWLIIILVITICGIYLYSKGSTPLDNYKSQASNILSEYKQGKITNAETKNKIESLNQKVKKEYEKEETTQSLVLTGIFQRIEWGLMKGELSDTEVSAYIQEIKNIK